MLYEMLVKLTDNGLIINAGTGSILFFEHIFSSDGISPDPKMIQKMEPQAYVTEVSSY